MELGKIYNFTTLAPSILGAVYKDMKVVGILSLKEAIKHSDVVTRHNTVKLTVTGLPDSVYNLTYLLLETTDGNTMVLAQEYIDPTTIVVVTMLNATIDIFDIDTAMLDSIKLRLRELGVTNFKVTTV